MKPSKTKKRPAKRGDGGNPMIDKLLKLKYRINDMYASGGPGVNENETKADKTFVMGLINNIRNGSNPISKIQMVECNRLWKVYRSELDYEG
tara:strand:- start:230 stop:505 length:276 start_codon:yes stop_codon:yes gene_type:complete